MLPRNLRAKIWRHYRPGQEIDKKPSVEYINAAQEVRDWIYEKYGEHGYAGPGGQSL